MKTVRMVIHAPHMEAVPIEEGRPPLVAPEHASFSTKLIRAKKELMAWNRLGRKIAPKPLRQARAAACAACHYYIANGNFGLGECAAPGCGCSRLKQALLTATCPHPQGSRWPATETKDVDKISF